MMIIIYDDDDFGDDDVNTVFFNSYLITIF